MFFCRVIAAASCLLFFQYLFIYLFLPWHWLTVQNVNQRHNSKTRVSACKCCCVNPALLCRYIQKFRWTGFKFYCVMMNKKHPSSVYGPRSVLFFCYRRHSDKHTLFCVTKKCGGWTAWIFSFHYWKYLRS